MSAALLPDVARLASKGIASRFEVGRSAAPTEGTSPIQMVMIFSDHRFSQGKMMSDSVKYLLPEDRIPKAWYNIAADLPAPQPPPLHPGTGQPIGPDDLAAIFPMALIAQEVSAQREIEIPEPVREAYKLWRPAPLYRARRLEKALDTPARIFYKYEGVSPSGSHKPNTAVPQAFYNKEAGISKLSTETGAGQWGSSLAFAGQLYGLEVKVYMVIVSLNQ